MPGPRRFSYEPLPAEWGRKERVRWTGMVDAIGDETNRTTEFAVHNDPNVRALWHDVLYNWNAPKEYHQDVMFTLRQYLQDEYGLDFDQVFDWAGYRRDYDQTAYSA